jgi:hypothetical protein
MKYKNNVAFQAFRVTCFLFLVSSYYVGSFLGGWSGREWFWGEITVRNKVATIQSRWPEDNVYWSVYSILFSLSTKHKRLLVWDNIHLVLIKGRKFPGSLTSGFCIYNVERCLFVVGKCSVFVFDRNKLRKGLLWLGVANRMQNHGCLGANVLLNIIIKEWQL